MFDLLEFQTLHEFSGIIFYPNERLRIPECFVSARHSNNYNPKLTTVILTFNCSPSEIIFKMSWASFPQVLKNDLTVGLKLEHSSSGQETSLLNSLVALNASLKSVGLLGSNLNRNEIEIYEYISLFFVVSNHCITSFLKDLFLYVFLTKMPFHGQKLPFHEGRLIQSLVYSFKYHGK